MKRIFHLFTFLHFLFLSVSMLNAQTQQELDAIKNIKPWEQVLQEPNILNGHVLNHSRKNASEMGTLPYDTLYAPFYHGVASGDPLTDRVIIWTRITPQDDNPIDVEWKMATDPEMTNIIQTGVFTTNAERDFTVKIDVTDLSPGSAYYYNFSALGVNSMTGRTRTVPVGNVNKLRFAVASCSHYQHGYFNAYGRIADRTDLDAVIHLGDYIYEYGPSGDFSSSIRQYEPEHEILSLEDYRTRHSLYKLDPDLRRAHQQHPFFTVWDDHEVANNAWLDGAENHDAGEGDYQTRKTNAIQAYFEWMPIREPEPGQPRKIYRTIHYGDMADLFMLDTRLEGREEQIPFSDPETNNPDRTILGHEQAEWLLNELGSSTAKWKVFGNQVVFTTINTLGLIDNNDMWDGYPAERLRFKNLIDSLGIKNFVVLTGDIHLGIAADITLDPTGSYNPDTGEGAFGVEFVTTSITSANDEALPAGIPVSLAETLALNANPHAKYINIPDHGYFVLDLDNTRAQADWYVIDTKLTPSITETFDAARYTLDQTSHLINSTTPAPDNPNSPDPAPVFTSTISPDSNPIVKPTGSVLFLAAYPNPSTGTEVHLHYALSKLQNITASIHDLSGKHLATLLNEQQQPGIYTLKFNTQAIPDGTYICSFLTQDGSKASRKIVIQR
ncbi:MAG: alkaline phosphatase D family protein [Sphingobacteriales bacterium]|nr:MAG: alkaline phosphatase D family protein [Sphingobacteriales bacterium]